MVGDTGKKAVRGRKRSPFSRGVSGWGPDPTLDGGSWLGQEDPALLRMEGSGKDCCHQHVICMAGGQRLQGQHQ